MLTVGEGQRVGIFAAAGVGKSTLIGMIARHTEAEIEKEMYDVAHTFYPFTIGSLIMEDKGISKIRDLVRERSL
jgi:ABC-type transport system involved in cytochrome bd biosynthesis fused ATPase/permease subunit